MAGVLSFTTGATRASIPHKIEYQQEKEMGGVYQKNEEKIQLFLLAIFCQVYPVIAYKSSLTDLQQKAASCHTKQTNNRQSTCQQQQTKKTLAHHE